MKIDTNWTLFLDRDGVINERIIDDYVKTPKTFIFIDGVLEALKLANSLFYKIVVVTNQQGIGKGLMSERNLIEIHRYCQLEVEKAGGRIDEFYFAPNLASENSELRKPNTGMAYLAQHHFPAIDFSKSILIGDSNSDIQFGEKLGMKTVFIHENETHPTADYTQKSLLEAIKHFTL